MGENFLGEIRLFSIPFAPKGWAPCNGQLLPINQNQALFSLLGTTYGGNGVTTFALPDLQGKTPIHFGTNVPLGTAGGEAQHTLTPNEIPRHTHQARASDTNAASPDPSGQNWAQASFPYSNAANLVQMNPNAIGTSGQSQPHDNMQPSLVIGLCIALQGIFPSRS